MTILTKKVVDKIGKDTGKNEGSVWKIIKELRITDRVWSSDVCFILKTVKNYNHVLDININTNLSLYH